MKRTRTLRWSSFSFRAASLLAAMSCSHSPTATEHGDAAVVASVLGADVRAEWAAIKAKDEKAYADLLDEDFRAVEVDAEGTRTKAQALRELQSTTAFDYTLSRLETRPLAADAAMVTYEAYLEFLPSAQVRHLRVYVCEVWTKREGTWKALHYQETRVR